MSEVRFRRGTAAWWTTINPVLLRGEPGHESDTGKLKVGDGTTAWASLAYTSGAGAVSSVAGRIGAVTLTATDVGLPNVDNTADTAKPVSTAQQTALNAKAPLASPTFTGTVSGISKSMVGLGSVDNTADSAKPVSTAQQAALDARAPAVISWFTASAWPARTSADPTIRYHWLGPMSAGQPSGPLSGDSVELVNGI